MANVVYTACRICRIKIHGRDRKILGTDGSMSYMADCRIHRSHICRILLYLLYQNSLTFKFWPSNGKDPLTRVYKITPSDQTSTSGPSYFFPCRKHIVMIIEDICRCMGSSISGTHAVYYRG